MYRTLLTLVTGYVPTVTLLKPSLMALAALGIIKVDRRYLREYRCPTCNKLLSKGYLSDQDSYLEVKCRGCNTICLFQGEDKEIIQTRAELIKDGLISGHELSDSEQNPKQA